MNENHDLKKPGGIAYERPNSKFRCGRASFWSKPCHNGPKQDGSCGGTSECIPVRKEGRFECCRPAAVGGPCTDGPKPDGSCSQTHPPCVPYRTLRTYRGRLAILSLFLVVVSILAFVNPQQNGSSYLSSIDPGPLSDKHANFIGKEGCIACHAPHNQGALGWLKASFTSHDMTSQCMACHTFDGLENTAHNETFQRYSELPQTTCVMCHTEHKGESFPVTKMTDAQCNTCHRTKFDGFSEGHPSFAANYPRVTRNIKFNHDTHLGQYFADPKYGNKTPACASCHLAAPNERRIRTEGFEKACASCHTDQIIKNFLVLIRLPDGGAQKLGSVSIDDATPFMAWLLEDPNDEKAYAGRVQKLIPQMGRHGLPPLANLLNTRAQSPVASKLLASLNPEVISSALEDAPPGAAPVAITEPPQGWFWRAGEGEELCYKPTGHADPIVRAWLEFGIEVATQAGTNDPNDRAKTLHDELLHAREGVGRCIKCHAMSEGKGKNDGLVERVEWQSQGRPSQAHTHFSHGTHIRLLSCTACHVFNKKAEFEAQFQSGGSIKATSNFEPIRKESCMECHDRGKVREDCQLCHTYHRDSFFRKQPWAKSPK